MKVEILQEAEEELNQAIVRYEEIEGTPTLLERMTKEACLSLRLSKRWKNTGMKIGPAEAAGSKSGVRVRRGSAFQPFSF